MPSMIKQYNNEKLNKLKIKMYNKKRKFEDLKKYQFVTLNFDHNV